jgi:hypothetical protein
MVLKHNKTSSKKQNKTKKRVFTKKDFGSGDGFLTTVWGPLLWTFLHTISFNYPINPTNNDKKHYREFIINLQNIIPCKYCRTNLKKNLKQLPLTIHHMKNRNTFSLYVYTLHEKVNKMLNKTSNLTYCDVRERYEHFRSRCTQPIDLSVSNLKKKINMHNHHNKTQKRPQQKEKGCTEPLHGNKSKCIIKIVPQQDTSKTFQVDKTCIKQR